MQILVKFTENQRSTNVITQELIDSEVVIDEDLQTFGICDFTMPIIDGIEEDTRVDIYEVTNTDQKIFSGFVYKIEPIWNTFGLMKIQCRDEKALMYKRQVITPIRMFRAMKVAEVPQYPTASNLGDVYWVGGSSPIMENTGLQVTEFDAAYSYKATYISDTTYIIDTLTNDIWKYNGVSSSIVGSGTGVDIKELLQEMVQDFDTYGESRAVTTDFNKGLIMDIKQGDNVFNIIDELATQCEANRDIKDGIVRFKRILGKDYSFGSEYQEIIYNSLYPNTANISNVSVVGVATQCNIAMIKNKSGKITIDTSQYTGFLKGIAIYDSRDGDESDKLEQYMNKINQKQRTYQVEVEQNGINANVGDKVKLIVENTNSFFDIDSAVTVIKKKTIYTNASKKVEYSVGEFVTTPVNVENLLYGIKKDIQLLKL